MSLGCPSQGMDTQAKNPVTPRGGRGAAASEDHISYSREVTRASLPEICLADDLMLALGVDETSLERLAVAGALGTTFRVNGRVAVLRADLLTALRECGGVR